ncbi:hypothetical protein [Streptomyces lydicus]|uniref:hypothetical protein n=1 Tax=Streptomyces lydicus TaxID=47763 RepID=UPI0037FC698B
MSVTTPTDPTPPQRTSREGAVWALLILVLVVGLLLTFALTYVTWRWPSLGTPLQVAGLGLGLFITLALALLRR